LQVIKVDPKKCTGCHQCELWCGTEIASVAKELAGAIQEEPQPVPRVYVEGKNLALQCRHCVEAPCLDACPNGTMRRDPETDLVYVHEPTCIACWMCVMVCPFGIINPSPTYKVAPSGSSIPRRLIRWRSNVIAAVTWGTRFVRKYARPRP
jgi:carbon-monoxide dehydrogenase iron sulfur subunit